MRVVVTGGTGLIGHELVMSLGKDGHEVYVVSRNPHQKGPMPESIHFVKWDAETAEGWGEVVDGADAVVNLAGASINGDGFLPERWTRERKDVILKSRLKVGKAVTEAIEQAATKPKVLIQASAVGYYGMHPHNEVITEDYPAGEDFLADVCQQWEDSTAAVEEMGVRRCIIRTGIVLSDEGGALPRLIVPFQMFAGGPIAGGKQPFPWIHMADQVGAIRHLIEETDMGGAFNLAAPEPPTNAEFSKAVGKAINRPAFIPTPGFVFEMAFGEVAVLLTKGQNTPPTRLQEAGYTFTFTDAQAAVADLYG